MPDSIPSAIAGPGRTAEARYAYYRRCQVFKKNGEQCKAPAEKGAHICYAHATEQATALRRKLQLTILLAEVVRRMRQRGKPEFEVADIFMDFNAIQVTLGLMAQAVIDGRIDCKTAGRLIIGLQAAAKLLRTIHRQGCGVHKEQQVRPQISAARQPQPKHPPRGHGDTEKLRAKVKIKISTQRTQRNSGVVEGEKTRNARLKQELLSRHGTNPIVSSADESRSRKALTTKNPTWNGDVGGDELSQVVLRDKPSTQIIEEREIAKIIPLRTVALNAEIAHGPPTQARAA